MAKLATRTVKATLGMVMITNPFFNNNWWLAYKRVHFPGSTSRFQSSSPRQFFHFLTSESPKFWGIDGFISNYWRVLVVSTSFCNTWDIYEKNVTLSEFSFHQPRSGNSAWSLSSQRGRWWSKYPGLNRYKLSDNNERLPTRIPLAMYGKNYYPQSGK